MVEMLFVILISSVVLGMGTQQFSKTADKRAVGNAGDAVVLAAHRARSEAMRSGTVVYLEFRTGEVVVVEEASGTDPLHTIDLSDYGVTMESGDLSICYTARGFALPGCTNIQDAATVTFTRGSDVAEVQVLPLGQIRRTQ